MRRRMPLLAAALVAAWVTAASAADVELFSRAGCPHCTAAEAFLAELAREAPGLEVRVVKVDDDPAARARLEALARDKGVRVAGVPAMRVGGELLFGFDRPETTGARIRALLDRPRVLPEAAAGMVCTADAVQACDDGMVRVPWLGEVRVADVGLPVFTLVVGLLDGFNPCAMWVLLFQLSLLVNLKSRARMAMVAGTFVAASGLVYFAFMAAWLNVFLLIGFSRAVQLALGVVALVVGALNVKEFFAFKQGLSLTIPAAAKPGLYARMRGILQAEHLASALVAVAALAVLVNFVELLCTAGFPVVYTHVLAARQLAPWQNYAYLALYNVAYMLDDGLIVTIAVVTLSRRRLQEREGRWLKLISGAIMLALALVLLFEPAWLAVLG